ncbi:MAG: tRNA lysidine(34) synthetase TilS [Pyrinomonadaceae bacterium]
MHKFVRNLITEWRRLDLPLEGTAVVAVSGGADSCALLAGMKDLKVRKKHSLRLVCAHFDHGIRGQQSVRDAEFVRDLAEQLEVEFVYTAGNVTTRGNLEQNARNARYAFLEKVVKKSKAVMLLTGHTMNDQAETFLINLIRGSGPDGLAAMPAIRPMKEGSWSPLLVRPMVRWTKRADTEEFCRDSGIEFRLDAMNQDTTFTRVRVRKTLLPLLAGFNPKIVENLASTAALMAAPGARHVALIDNLPQNLSISELKRLQGSDMYEILRQWLKMRRGNLRSIGLRHIQAIETLIRSTKSGKTIELPGQQNVSRVGGMLVFTEIEVEK